ncbi:hypothetical protein JHK87_012215 [Glycine soja]|nr:hypothetical protein JHK87_012215 [Glycine soja]
MHGSIRTTPSIHCLPLGLLGYLIPFAPLAIISQCQYRPSRVLSPLVFFPISMHFTTPPEIPSAPAESGSGLSPSVVNHPLRPTIDHRHGMLLPHQLANQTRVPPRADSSFCFSAYGVLAAVSSCCSPPKDKADSKFSSIPTHNLYPDASYSTGVRSQKYSRPTRLVIPRTSYPFSIIIRS